MARPLRIEFSGAVYHVTSRGDRREPIFDDDEDRMNLLSVVAQNQTEPNWGQVSPFAWMSAIITTWHVLSESNSPVRCIT